MPEEHNPRAARKPRPLPAAATVAIAIALLVLPSYVLPLVVARPGAILPGYVRLQVVANSDSAHDQAVKEGVRDAVRGALAGSVSVPETQAEALLTLAVQLDDVRSAVDGALAEHGAPYPAEVELGRMDFPPKSYGGTAVPAGTYPALRVTLGAGAGRNWWCVVFPPLCFVDAGSGVAAGGEIEVRSWLLERFAAQWPPAGDGPAGIPLDVIPPLQLGPAGAQ